MSPVNILRALASRLRHAIVLDQVITEDGRVECQRELHYLTCRRCELERQADAIERFYSAS